MSDSGIPDQGASNSSNLGGKRIPGQRSAAGQNARDSTIRIIKEIWGVSEFVDIFPANIRPTGDLGDSAISNLRSIARKVPNLGSARALMISECVDASGRASSFSFKHTASILKQLKAMEETVKDENPEKAKALNPGEKKTEEAVAKKAKVTGKPPGLPVSKGASRASEGNAKKEGRSLASLFVASKESAANKSATETSDRSFKATPAKKDFADKTKAATPASKIGIVLDTPSVPKARQRKEPATGLHAPNREDVAPFRKTLATSKVPAFKNASAQEAFPLKATHDKEIANKANFEGVSPQVANQKESPYGNTKAPTKQITREETQHKRKTPKNHRALAFSAIKQPRESSSRVYGREVDDVFRDGLFQEEFMTDETGIPIEQNKRGSKISTKSLSEDVEAMSYGGLPFNKDSIMGEMKSKKRVVEKHGRTVTFLLPSEADSQIGMASVSTLRRDSVHRESGFEEAAEAITTKNKATDAGVAEDKNVQGKVVKSGEKRKFVASGDEADVQDDVNVAVPAGKRIEKRKILMPAAIHPKLDVPFTTYFDKPSKDITELWRDRELARASIQQTPTSPIDSGFPIHEVNLFNTSRPTSEISDPRLSGNKAKTGKNLTSKTALESIVPELNSTMERSVDYNYVNSKRDISEYSFSELVELSRAKAAQATKAGKRSAMAAKDPMDYTIRELRDYLEENQPRQRPTKRPRGEAPSQVLAGILSSTPEKLALPKLPETLIARERTDRVLITSVPAIVKAYVEQLRARIAGGLGPDGDLMSMIIVNKYGYFLEHVDKLEKDLESLYYETLERNP